MADCGHYADPFSPHLHICHRSESPFVAGFLDCVAAGTTPGRSQRSLTGIISITFFFSVGIGGCPGRSPVK